MLGISRIEEGEGRTENISLKGNALCGLEEEGEDVWERK